MSKVQLFTDGSYSPQYKIGVGAFLLIEDDNIEHRDEQRVIQLKTFKETSSSKLEIQTALWALQQIEPKGNEITVYTDAQSIMGLSKRRTSLEQNGYHTKKGRLLNNHIEYREFFKLTDRYNCTFVKIKGHQPAKKKNELEKIFSFVDKGSRKALREIVSSLK